LVKTNSGKDLLQTECEEEKLQMSLYKKASIFSFVVFGIVLISENSFAGEGHFGGHMKHMMDVKGLLEKELGDDYTKSLPTPTEENLRNGKKIFAANCVLCHGQTGKGDGPAAVGFASKPADFTDPGHSRFYSDRGRFWIIKNGIGKV